MRVLFVLDSLSSGGTERSTIELLPALLERGVDPHVAVLRNPGGAPLGRSLDDLGMRPVVLGNGSLLQRTRSLRQLLRNLEVDIVHSALYRANLTARFAKRRGSVLVNSIVSDAYSPLRFALDPGVSKYKLWAVQKFDAWTARRYVDRFHCVSAAARDRAVEQLGIDRVRTTVVHRGRRAGDFRRAAAEERRSRRAALGLPENGLLALTVGRQDYMKDQVTLVEAFAQLRRVGGPRLHLAIAGRASKASVDLKRRIARNDLEGTVHLLGPRNDVPDLLAVADLFVFSSLLEGFPGAVLEAMAAGLPIVASDLGAIVEMVEEGENAVLVPAREAAAFAAAITDLVREPKRLEEYGVRSRLLFERRFTIEAIAAQMVEFYRSCLEDGAAPSRHASISS